MSIFYLVFRQAKALVWRYATILKRLYIQTAIRLILWPIVALVGVSLGCRMLEAKVGPEKFRKYPLLGASVPTISLLLTIFHLHHYLDYIITDRSSGFRSLMMIMGLRRVAYYLANFFCIAVYVVPMTIITAIFNQSHIFQDSQASALELIGVSVLFGLHLSAFMTALTSMICSTQILAILSIGLLFIDPLYHWTVTDKMVNEASGEILIFLISFLPSVPIRMFSESYSVCNNCGTKIYLPEPIFARISQPTDIVLQTAAFWTVVWLLFAHWFDQVCPWTVDLPAKSPLCCVRSSSSQDLNTHERPIEMDLFFEGKTTRQPVGIQISCVTKKFDQVPAVDALSFNIHRGETTLLLGHNGAGKTTLMNMIFGKLNPDSGSVTINPPSVNNVPIETPFIGVCLQSNVFDEKLTVRQHLELFADIKSAPMTPVERTHHIKTTIDDVSLTGHADKTPEELSGGMKRKLSLAMAFVGRSSVLILDEPSSGLDPDSRILVWDAIRRYRADRTVLLSTQHMEEADYLGDRIAIMKAGKIVCCGSSSFLNKMLGFAYRLRVEYIGSKRDEVLTFIRSYFDMSSVENDFLDFGSQMNSDENNFTSMVVQLKSSSSKDAELNLIKMLEDLENRITSHCIKSFALNSSSIEDVMLQTADSGTVLDDSSSSKVYVDLLQPIINTLLKAPKISTDSSLKAELYLLRALLYKHLHVYRRSFLSIIFYRLLLPFVGLSAFYEIVTYDEVRKPTICNYLGLLIIFHYVDYVFLDKILKFKTIQLASNANLTTYWLAQLMIDSLSVVNLIICIIYWLKHEFRSLDPALKEGPPISTQLMLSAAVGLFAIAALFFAYTISTLANSKVAAYWFTLMPIIASFILRHLIRFILNEATDEYMKSTLLIVNRLIEGFFIILLPIDALWYLMQALRDKCHTILIDQEEVDHLAVSLGFLVLLCQVIVYSLLLYIIEHRTLCTSHFQGDFKRPPNPQKDPDVVAEASKAKLAIDDPNNSLCLVAADLSKSYKRGVNVIDDLWFTVARGECFGLLGVNGAGKSTTFSILAAERRPDRGRVCLRGNYLDDNLNLYRRNIGYDPQISPAELSMSASEALYLMARLRQVEESAIPMLVSSILDVLDMSQHAAKVASELSGGTLRKLSLGMSLIGNPDLLLLDEPTAGVDPLARRRIWRLLRSLCNNGTSIVIASHAMEECEAICDRISIMARGRLRCIGSFLHLRNKFSQSCSVRIQFSAEGDYYTGEMATHTRTIEQLSERLNAIFGPHIELVDSNISSVTYSISDRHFKRSVLFKTLREFKQTQQTISYLINDSSLENIFLKVAQEQQEQGKLDSSRAVGIAL